MQNCRWKGCFLNFFVQRMLFLWAMRIVPVIGISCLIALQTQCNAFLLISYNELALVYYKNTFLAYFVLENHDFLFFSDFRHGPKVA